MFFFFSSFLSLYLAGIEGAAKVRPITDVVKVNVLAFLVTLSLQLHPLFLQRILHLRELIRVRWLQPSRIKPLQRGP
jgi:hypothetical protein